MSPVSGPNRANPTYPNVPPKPATDPTARLGNMSDTSVYRLDENPWWAASASPAMPTTYQGLGIFEANTAGMTITAQISIDDLRAAFTLNPWWIMNDDSHPPHTPPIPDIR